MTNGKRKRRKDIGLMETGTETSNGNGMRARKITAQWPARCSACDTRIGKNTTAWYCRGAPSGERMRCLSCGPHPGAAVPSVNRRTNAELGKTAQSKTIDRTPPNANELAAQLQNSIDREQRAMKLLQNGEAAGGAAMEHGQTSTDNGQTSTGNKHDNGLTKRVAALETTTGTLVNELNAWTGQTAKLADAVEALRKQAPKVLVVQQAKLPDVKIEGAHARLEAVLKRIAAGFKNLFLVGPMGTGKSTIAKHAADALSKRFGQLSGSSGVTEAHLFGRVLPQADGAWKHQPTLFLDIWENGGLFCLDELDSFESNLLIALNSGLANGMLTNPVSGQVHKRSMEPGKECIIIATANTFGLGADAIYCGRNQLDGATLDRFIGATFLIDYDVDLEQRIASTLLGKSAAGLVGRIHNIRARAAQNKLRRGVSTRMVEAVSKLVASGMRLEDAVQELLVSWSDDEKRKVL